MSSSESAWFYPPAPAPELDGPVVAGRTRRFRGPSLAREVAILTPLLALLVAWFVMLRPTYLGGSSTLVKVSGSGMEPTLRDGDLAVVRERASYGPGDVVALNVPQEDGSSAIVVRRIVGGSASSGFVVRGDDRDAADPWHPGHERVIGQVWFRVAAGGRLLGWLQQPVALAGLAALVIVTFVLAGGRSTRRSVRSAAAADEPAVPVPAASAEDVETPPTAPAAPPPTTPTAPGPEPDGVPPGPRPEGMDAIDALVEELRADAHEILREAARRADETRRKADAETVRARAELELLRAELEAERARFSAHLRSVADGIGRALEELEGVTVAVEDLTIVVADRSADAESPRPPERAPSTERAAGG
jgi:signal peptidase